MNRRQMLKTIATMTPILAAGVAAAAQTPRQADPSNLLDLNSAPPEKLMTLSGIDMIAAKKIIAGRPYRTKNDLVTKKIIPQEAFNVIQGRVTVVAAPAPARNR